jgi:putative FmdB family regulatory protein
MPTYDYKCTACENTFEVEQRISEAALTTCPTCQGKVRRLITGGAGISFKGSGFYSNDSKAPKETPKTDNCKTCATGNCPAKN